MLLAALVPLELEVAVLVPLELGAAVLVPLQLGAAALVPLEVALGLALEAALAPLGPASEVALAPLGPALEVALVPHLHTLVELLAVPSLHPVPDTIIHHLHVNTLVFTLKVQFFVHLSTLNLSCQL